MSLPTYAKGITRVDEVTYDGLRTITLVERDGRIEIHLTNPDELTGNEIDMPTGVAIAAAADILRWALLYRQGQLWEHLGKDAAVSLLDTTSGITDPMRGLLGKHPAIHVDSDTSIELGSADG